MIPKDTHPSNLLSYLQQHHITSPHHFVLVLVLFILRFCLSVHNFHVLCIKYSTITQIAQFLSTSQNEKAPYKDKNTLQSSHVKKKCYQASVSTNWQRYRNIKRFFWWETVSSSEIFFGSAPFKNVQALSQMALICINSDKRRWKLFSTEGH